MDQPQVRNLAQLHLKAEGSLRAIQVQDLILHHLQEEVSPVVTFPVAALEEDPPEAVSAVGAQPEVEILAAAEVVAAEQDK